MLLRKCSLSLSSLLKLSITYVEKYATDEEYACSDSYAALFYVHIVKIFMSFTRQPGYQVDYVV